MRDQPYYRPLEQSSFFGDEQSARQPVEDTVARGQLQADTLLYTGMGPDGKPATQFPYPVTRDMLLRGQERFDIYCAPCHGQAGDGQGMIVRRGFRQPPTYHQPRLQQAPVGHFFDVITNGFGAMPDYRSQVPVEDRWAIIAYIRALQFSQNAPANQLPPEDRAKVNAGGQK